MKEDDMKTFYEELHTNIWEKINCKIVLPIFRNFKKQKLMVALEGDSLSQIIKRNIDAQMPDSLKWQICESIREGRT